MKMTNEQILLAAIKKAEENGFCFFNEEDSFEDYVEFCDYKFYEDKWKAHDDIVHINEILFDHEFAKAFWGEEIIFDSLGNGHTIGSRGRCLGTAWEHHLQQLATSEDKIQYLKQFL